MKYKNLLLILLLTVGCQNKPNNNSRNTTSEDVVIESIAVKCDNDTIVVQNIRQYIVLNRGAIDYFENPKFRIEDYVEEVNFEIFMANMRNNMNFDPTIKISMEENRYIIALENNSNIILENIEFTIGSDEMMEYRFKGFIAEINAYLFNIESFFGWGYKLISKKDGKTIFLRDKPIFSPTFTYLVTIRFDGEGGFLGSMEFFKCDFEQTHLLFGLWSYSIFPIKGYWKSDYELYIKAYYKTPFDDSKIKYYRLFIKR